jgi:endonuclease G
LNKKHVIGQKKYHNLYVITGGILEDHLKTIGKEKVSVPNYFYKVLLDNTQPEIKAIAFLIPHKNSNKSLYTYVVSIDELEQKTGLDFFKNLPDSLEDKLEKSVNYKNWSFK